MSSVLKYQIDHESELIRHTLKGIITLDEIIEHLRNTFSAPDYNDSYSILVDLRESDIPDFIPRIDEFLEFTKDFSQKINMRRKCAILTERPLDAANAAYLILKLNDLRTGMYFRAFSTEAIARDWLSIS